MPLSTSRGTAAGWPSSTAGSSGRSSRRTTILLSPADLPKRGTHYDLAIAVAVLGATGAVPTGTLAKVVFIGELTLAGGLRSVPGVLPMVMAACERGYRHVVVPEPQAREASMVPGMEVLGMRSLAQVVAELRDEPVPDAPPVAPMSRTPAAGLARRRPDGGGRPRGPVRDGGRPLRRRGGRRRWPPPAAVRPEGLRARPASRSGSPRCCPTWAARRRSSSPPCTRWPVPSSPATGC